VIIGILAAVAIPRFQGVSDKAKIGAAKAELSHVRTLLTSYQAENDTSRYPETSMIGSHADLVTVCAPYGSVPAAGDASFSFQSYASAVSDTFVLIAKAKDRNRTVLTMTPITITP
jgi:type II secretory pathway pseudopilin PulG